jgi:hypothetical protein
MANTAKKINEKEVSKMKVLKAENVKEQSIDERISKVSKLHALTVQREKIIASRTTIEQLMASSDSKDTRLSIVDDGVNFHTSNSSIIEKIMDLIKSEINIQLEKCESQIQLD